MRMIGGETGTYHWFFGNQPVCYPRGSITLHHGSRSGKGFRRVGLPGDETVIPIVWVAPVFEAESSKFPSGTGEDALRERRQTGNSLLDGRTTKHDWLDRRMTDQVHALACKSYVR